MCLPAQYRMRIGSSSARISFQEQTTINEGMIVTLTNTSASTRRRLRNVGEGAEQAMERRPVKSGLRMRKFRGVRFLAAVGLMSVVTCAPAGILAQTNTFPSSGSVGIGTTMPGADLEIDGTNINLFLDSTAGSQATITFQHNA